MHLREAKEQFPVQDVSREDFFGADSRSETDKSANILKELSMALSQAAELLEETAPLDDVPLHRIERGIDFYQEVTKFEIRLIRYALRLTRGNQKEAAQLLGIGSTTLNAMIKRYGVDSRIEF